MPLFKRKKQYNLKDVLAVGRPLQIITDAGEHNYVYKSSVADFDGGSIVISPLTRDGLPAQLKMGDRIDVVYFADDAMYKFPSNVTGRKKENNAALTVIERPHKCSRMQRRNFYRLSFDLEASFREIRVEKRKGRKYYAPEEKVYSCAIEDVSGGGLSFITKEDLIDGALIEMTFYLPAVDDEQNGVRQILKVIRTKHIKPIGTTGENAYTYGGRFVMIDNDEQAKIIRFIMRKQIEFRKKAEQSA